MSDDEADPELLELLRQHLLGKPPSRDADPETGVLNDVEWLYDNSIDVSLNMRATKNAAALIYSQMQAKSYSTQNWADHPFHPKTKDDAALAFIFTMDLLNFSFWSAVEDQDERFAVEYEGKRWTGYASLVASMQRALDEGIPITDPHWWQSEDECTLETLGHVFRSCTDEQIPLLEERLECLREAGQVLYEVSTIISSLSRQQSGGTQKEDLSSTSNIITNNNTRNTTAPSPTSSHQPPSPPRGSSTRWPQTLPASTTPLPPLPSSRTAAASRPSGSSSARRSWSPTYGRALTAKGSASSATLTRSPSLPTTASPRAWPSWGASSTARLCWAWWRERRSWRAGVTSRCRFGVSHCSRTLSLFSSLP